MKVIKIFFLIALTLSGNLVHAQEQPFMLTLVQAREYALQHNKSLLNARDQVSSSKEKLKETIAQGLLQLNGSLDYMTYFNYEMNFSFGGTGEGIDFNNPLFDDGDREILSTIGTMFGSSAPIILDDQLSGNIQVSQLLFSGQYLEGV